MNACARARYEKRTKSSMALVIATWLGFVKRAWITSGPAVRPTPTPTIAMNLTQQGQDERIRKGCIAHPFTSVCMLRCMAHWINPTPTVITVFPSTIG